MGFRSFDISCWGLKGEEVNQLLTTSNFIHFTLMEKHFGNCNTKTHYKNLKIVDHLVLKSLKLNAIHIFKGN